MRIGVRIVEARGLVSIHCGRRTRPFDADGMTVTEARDVLIDHCLEVGIDAASGAEHDTVWVTSDCQLHAGSQSLVVTVVEVSK